MTGLEDKEVVDELEDGELEESEDEDKIETKSIGNVHEKEFKPFSNFVVGVKESEVKVESRISSRNKYSENKASKNKVGIELSNLFFLFFFCFFFKFISNSNQSISINILSYHHKLKKRNLKKGI